MRGPGAAAAALVRAPDRDATLIEPERHRTTSPRIDAVDHRQDGAATEAGRHLAHDRIEPVAGDRQRRLSGDDRDLAAARRVATERAGAIQPVSRPTPGRG